MKKTLCIFLITISLLFSANIDESNDLEKIITTMTLEDKIGQVFISIIYGEKLKDEAKEFIKKTRIGNFLLFPWANGLNSFHQVKQLTSELSDFVLSEIGIFPLIATDQEGGKVSRLINGFTLFPSNREIAQKSSIAAAYNMGKIIAQEMNLAGLNLNFAPVVDVCSDSTYCFFPRTYSGDPDIVILYAKEMIKGLHDGGVLSTLKHFPGHGDAKVDSHFELPVVDKSLEELEKRELKPFYFLKDETDFIMSSHIIFPALDENNCASLSKTILTDLLRNKYGYEGVIITDSLAMRGIVPNQRNYEETLHGIVEAAIKAFNAGSDCAILSKLEWADYENTEKQDMKFIKKVLKEFKNALLCGRISENKLDESVKRILQTKMKIAKIK